MSDGRVLVVGNCDQDHRAIQTLVQQQFCVDVDRAETSAEVEKALETEQYSLILVNRQFFADGGDGVELIGKIKSADRLGQTPAMLISNFPEAQAAAVAGGAVPGFGKAAITASETIERLAQYLPQREGTVAQ